MNRKISTSILSVIAGMSIIAGACYSPPPSNVMTASNSSEANANRAVAERSPGPAAVNTNTEKEKTLKGFEANLPDGFAAPATSVERTLLREYGSVFVAKGVRVPTKIVFRDQSEVAAFQAGLNTAAESIGGLRMELQSAAIDDLRKAIAEAKSEGLSITPRDADSARRSYDETVELWKSRVDPALKHWVANGKITQADAGRISALSPFEQVPEVLKLEEKGIYFARDLSKSIIYSVAPPGTSQHLSMLALDVKEFDDARVRAMLARHRWYQTVVSDLPHFTYLGADEGELSGLGLKRVSSGGRNFWVPDI